MTTLTYILLVAFCFLSIPLISRWLGHSVGRITLCLIPVWLTMFITIYFKLNAGSHLSYVVFFDSRFILMATVILPGIVFRLEERPALILCLGSTTTFLLFYDFIHEAFGAGYYQLGFEGSVYSYINYIVSVTYLTLLFGVLLLRSILEKSERSLLLQNSELIEKQNEIEAQHEELLQQQEEMQASGEKLEQANALITRQQETLAKYNKQLETLVAEKSSELVKTNEELVKHNNELLQFSYTVSHNLRGPVARMIGLTRLLNHPESNDDRGKLQDLILKSSEELDEILKDLSLIIDIRNDLYKIHEKVFLEEEWNKAVTLIGEGTRSVYSLDVNFSASPYIYGVRPMLQSIFYNLFSNAIKYQSPNRKLKVNVKSYVIHDGRKVIEITDNGLGIDLVGQKNNLFKLYKRFHPHISGKGLGLFLVKTQVEALKGEIFVDSELDRGTTFKMIFPEPEEISRQVFYDNDVVQFYYDASLNVIVVAWKRPATSEEYRMAFQHLISALHQYQSPGVIGDVRNGGSMGEEDQHWFATAILPPLVEATDGKIGVIGLENAPAKKEYYERVMQLSKNIDLELKLLSNIHESYVWLKPTAASKR